MRMLRKLGVGAAVALVLGLTLALVVAGRARSAAPARPNIVFVLTDDQRWDAMGCAGHPFVKTPHIDRLAREGVRFRNAFVTTPLCSPSRASFLTGQYVHTHGVRDNTNHNTLSHQLVTFPLLLQRAGYETAYVGKWHMGNDDTPRPGFDRWVSFKGQGAYRDPALNIDGKPTREEGYVTDLLTDYAVEFLNRRHQKPFLLYLAHKAVHGPFTPAERHQALYADAPIRRSPNAMDTLQGKPVLQRPLNNLPPLGPGTGSGDPLIRNQLRTLTAVDEGLGRVLQALERTGQLDNTIVIFGSDNGYFWGEHGLGDKRAAYEESVRVPLLARYPRLIRPGSIRDEAVLNIDVAPTLLELGGAPIPAGIQGRSLTPLLRGRSRRWRPGILLEYFAEPAFPRIPTWQAVRTEQWKYIHYPDLTGMDELYDLKADRYEMKNLIDAPGARSARERMTAELARLQRETAAAVP